MTYVIKNAAGRYFTGYQNFQPSFDATDPSAAAHYDSRDATLIIDAMIRRGGGALFACEWHSKRPTKREG